MSELFKLVVASIIVTMMPVVPAIAQQPSQQTPTLGQGQGQGQGGMMGQGGQGGGMMGHGQGGMMGQGGQSGGMMGQDLERRHDGPERQGWRPDGPPHHGPRPRWDDGPGRHDGPRPRWDDGPIVSRPSVARRLDGETICTSQSVTPETAHLR